LPAPLRVQSAIVRLWTKSFASEEEAFGSREFSELARQCHAVYRAPDWPDPGRKHGAREPGDAKYVEWHKQKLQTAFRNVGAPWYDGTFPDPQRVSEIIDFAYKGGMSTRIFLAPLDRAPSSFPKAKFGPCRIGRFAKEELADIVKPAVFDRNKHDQFDVARFSQFSWLVVEESVSLPQAAERDSFTKFLNTEVGAHSKVAVHSRAFSAIVEHVLSALILHPWEDFVRSAEIWRPFVIPWIYPVKGDPFETPPPAPDVDSLSWELGSYQTTEGRIEFDRPTTSIVKNGAFEDLEARLSQTWIALEEVCPLGHTGSTALNPFIEHFLLRAYLERGIDELIMHMTAIDAAIGNCKFNKNRPKKKKYDGMTKALSARMCALLCDPSVGPQFCALYDRRSEYIHGRLGAEGEIKIEDLNSARRLARPVARAVLEYAVNHPDRSRDDMLADLDETAQ
jgi:hypothetical protein